MERGDKVNSLITTFIVIGVFVYVFSGLTGLNLVRYYPVLREWSVTKLDGPSMGFFGKLLFALPITAIITLLYAAVYDWTTKTFGKLCCRGLAIGSLIFGYFFYVAEEWHKWGIDKPGLDNGKFINNEFWFFIVVMILALISLMIPAYIYKKDKV